MSITITPRSFAAFAAGIVVSLLVTLVVADWRADAAPGDTDTTFVPIAPCRLFDLRPGDENVGPRSTPLGADETYEQQVAGTNGDCVLPDGITAVSMNVTAVLPTAASHLTLYPAGTPTPSASNLNWVAGQPPTPNKVDVKLSAGGAIEMYNPFGEVYLLADVSGYYTDSSLDEIEQRLSVLETPGATDVLVGEASGGEFTELPMDGTVVELESVSVVAPVAGTVIVNSSASASDQTAGGKIFCSVSPDASMQAPFLSWESAGSDGSIGQLGGTVLFEVEPGAHTYRYNCQSATSAEPLGNVSSVVLTYVFVPN